MTPAELNAIRERCEAATAGPLTVVAADTRFRSVFDRAEVFEVGSPGQGIGVAIVPGSRANADFFARASTDIPALLAEIARLRNQVWAISRRRIW